MGSIKISCTGDFMPADTDYTLGSGIGYRMSVLTEYYSSLENKPFQDADITFCNLESPLVKSLGIEELQFAGNPKVVELLKILNVDIVSIANNHMLDHEKEGFDNTIQTLKKNGIIQIGAIENNHSGIVLLERKGRKVAFSAFNAVHDNHDLSFIAPLEKGLVLRTLKEIKKLSPDFTIFSFHWGNEYITYPSTDQIDLAHELIDKGVNIILGHHPHVVQPIERYKGGIIAYSLGNFLFDMFWSEKVRNGMQLDLILNDDKSIDYHVKLFRIRADFTQDYSITEKGYSILEKSERKMKELLSGTREEYEIEYIRESKKRRFEARVKMKIYLLRNIFRLSSQTRRVIFKKIKMKFNSL